MLNFFGQQLQEILDVPVGLIHTSWGASTIQAWMSSEVLEKFEAFDPEKFNFKEKPNRIPTALYNSMIHPLTPFTIRGGLWCQGEANRKEPERYKQLFPAVVED